jgi:hypothetical protein
MKRQEGLSQARVVDISGNDRALDAAVDLVPMGRNSKRLLEHLAEMIRAQATSRAKAVIGNRSARCSSM